MLVVFIKAVQNHKNNSFHSPSAHLLSTPPTGPSDVIHYEYPFNERIRTFLRLEDLFDRYALFAARETAHDHDVAVRTVLDILDVAGRADLKMDLIQELERQRQVLSSFRNNPDISEDTLNAVIQDIETANACLLAMNGKLGQSLRDNEWLMAVKGRTTIPGGLCEFDLPGYHYWLHLSPEQRNRFLNDWTAPLQPVRSALAIILRLLRSSGNTRSLSTQNGQFQQALSGNGIQMAQVALDENLPFVPEVSANRFAVNIRFVDAEPRMDGRARIAQIPVNFELTLCSL